MSRDCGDNRAMRPSRVLIWLLLLTTLLVDCVVWSAVGAGERLHAASWPHPALGVLFALAFSQVSLTAIWAALATERVSWRLAGAVLVFATWNAVLATLSNERLSDGRLSDGRTGYNSTQWVALLAGQILVVFAPSAVARARGVRFVVVTADGPLPDRSAGYSRWQFSIASLLAWMTTTGVVLGMIQYTVDDQSLLLASRVWLDAGILIVGHSAMAWAALWAVFGIGRPTPRGMALCLTVGTVLALYVTLPKTSAHATAMAILCLLQATLLVGSLSVGRVAGYRLHRPADNEQPDVA